MRPRISQRQLKLSREYAAAGGPPAAARDAATVLLLRDGPGDGGLGDGPGSGANSGGVEVFMMVRRRSMVFAPGAAVFPGGGVDELDRVVTSTGIGPAEPTGSRCPEREQAASRDAMPVGVTALAARMGCSDDVARAVVRAAVRELAEETGVRVAPGDLGLWDAWTTPLYEPRRYRTWFFTARLPEGQDAAELSTESSSVAWVRPAEALARMAAGEWTMLPPTYWSCVRLATFDTVDAVMAATREARVEMFTPEIVDDEFTVPAWAAALEER